MMSFSIYEKAICLEILTDCIEFIEALDSIDVLIICLPAHIHRINFIFLVLNFFNLCDIFILSMPCIPKLIYHLYDG